jgi:membrane-bound serine protease (ClpP class)
MIRLNLFCVIVSLLLTVSIGAFASGEKAEKQRILQVNLRSEVNSVAWIEVSKGLERAKDDAYHVVLLNMNTYGGEVLYADSIRTAILNSPIPVYVFINNNAASAGALISIACDKVFMRSSATIGASTVVDQTGAAAPDKYQSYMRGIIRATAESHGKDTLVANGDTTYRWKRDPRIAEAMVDPDVAIPGLIDTGKVLTFTASEAFTNGYCDAITENVGDLIGRQLSISEYTLDVFQLSGWDRLKGNLMGTAFRAILIMLIVGGIWFEIQAPGIGLPTLVSVVSAIFYFAPLYMDGLAQNWEIILFILGFVLLLMEVFVIPGFGIAGVSGIIAIIIGLTAALVDNATFEFSWSGWNVAGEQLLLVTLSIVTALIVSVWLTYKIGMKGSFMRFAALDTIQSKEDGYLGVPPETGLLINAKGVAETVLRPSGKIRIDGKQYDAKCIFGYIEKGETIRVVRFESGQLYVVRSEK